MGGVTKSAHSVSLAVTSSVSLVPACGQNSLTPLLRLSPPRGARRGPLCENCARSLCSAFPHATRFAGLARRPQSVLPKRLRPQARVVGQPPHERRHLGRRQTGRARSKRKERFGGSVRAERVPPCRRRGDGWHSLVVALIKRDALGESLGPGRARIPLRPLSAGAGLAVIGGRRGPTRASAPTGRYEGWTCVSARSPRPRHPCRGGCPHPPVSRPHPPPDKAQANLEEQSFRHPPRGLHQTGNRGARLAQLTGTARAGRRLPCLSRYKFGKPPF